MKRWGDRQQQKLQGPRKREIYREIYREMYREMYRERDVGTGSINRPTVAAASGAGGVRGGRAFMIATTPHNGSASISGRGPFRAHFRSNPTAIHRVQSVVPNRYRLQTRFTGLDRGRLGSSTTTDWDSRCFTGFYWVVMGCTGLYRVSSGFIEFDWVFTGFYRVSSGFIEFDWVFTGLNWVITGFY